MYLDSHDYSGDTLRASRAIYRYIVNELGTSGTATITYGELAEKLGRHHRSLRFPLAKVQDECRSKGLPTLTTLVVDKNKRIPNEGCDAGTTADFPDYRRRVAETDWPPSPWW